MSTRIRKPLTDEQKRKQAEANKRWAENNREKLREIKRESERRARENPESHEVQKARKRRWYQEHKHEASPLTEEQREKRREINRHYVETHREELREKSREWARAHPQENRERVKKWALENPDKVHSEERRARAREYSQKWREQNPEKVKAYSRRSYAETGRDKYAKTRNGRRLPGGLCSLCGREETALARHSTGEVRALQQDHCHATGVLRGLLCLDCNRLLGAAKDRPGLLRAAAAYIEKYRELPSVDYFDGHA